MKMRAAVLERFGEPLEVQELELAEPRGDEVLVRLAACGVCHTDLFTASGADPSGCAPAVLGHEGAGVVEQVGEDVRDVAVGDHVVTLGHGLRGIRERAELYDGSLDVGTGSRGGTVVRARLPVRTGS